MVAVTTALGSLNDAVAAQEYAVRPVYTKTTGAETLTAAQVIDGIVNQSAAQAAFNLTLPTAALIVAGLVAPKVGMTFEFTIVNSAGGAAITVVAGTGVTLVGAAAAAIAGSANFVAVVTNVTASTEAVTFYRKN